MNELENLSQNNPLGYKRDILHQTSDFEIVSCTWTKGAYSAPHSHGWSQCSVLIVEGEFKNTFYQGPNQQVVYYKPGDLMNTAVGCKHDVECLSDTGRTFHVYTPRLQALPQNFQFVPRSPQAVREQVDLSLGESGIGLCAIKKLLEQIQNLNIQTQSVYFMNQLFASVYPETLMATETIAKSRTTAATFEASPIFTTIELEAIDKLGQLIGWPKEKRDGITVSGGSAANFMALHCARQRHNPEYKNKGLNPAHKYKIFVSEESHYSFKKACVVLGLGLDSLINIKADARGKMRTDDLESQIQFALANGEIPLLVNATAGTTVLGAFDPISKIADICQKYNIWLHVDGAWGGPVLFSDRRSELLSQVERADSMTFDAHKLLGANLTCSFFLTQHTGLLFEANDVAGGDYLFHSENGIPDLGRQSWQCGRSPDAFNFWTLWKSQGSIGFKNLLHHLYSVRDESLAWIKTQPRLELVAQPEFLNLCVRIIPPADQDEATWSQVVRQKLKEKNQVMVNYSADKNGSFLRLILAHPEIQTEHVQQIFVWALDVH